VCFSLVKNLFWVSTLQLRTQLSISMCEYSAYVVLTNKDKSGVLCMWEYRWQSTGLRGEGLVPLWAINSCMIQGKLPQCSVFIQCFVNQNLFTQKMRDPYHNCCPIAIENLKLSMSLCHSLIFKVFSKIMHFSCFFVIAHHSSWSRGESE
jgi:hypothetical protein